MCDSVGFIRLATERGNADLGGIMSGGLCPVSTLNIAAASALLTLAGNQ